AGQHNKQDRTRFRGAIAANTLQVWANAMWRWTRGLTLYGELRAVSSVDIAANGDTMHVLDARTTVTVMAHGDANLEEVHGASATLGLHWARKRFRLRAGVGYGNYSVPVLNFVVPVAIPFPELDVYWVF